MATKADIVEKYAVAPAGKRIEIIYKNYHNFERIIKGKVENLCFSITEDREYNRRKEIGDLGIRVQTSGHYSNPTCNTALNETTLFQAIMNCDFSDGILNGTDREEEYISDAFTLRKMRVEFNLFNRQMMYLDESEKEEFLVFLMKKKSIEDLADELGVQYHTVIRKMNRFKKIVKDETVKVIEKEERYTCQ